MFRAPIHPRVSKQLERAEKRLRKASKKDGRLPILFLIDPIRTFVDAGIELAPETRKYLRRTYPEYFERDRSMYDDVRDGKRQLPWIKKAKFRSRSRTDLTEVK